jgi:CRISPR/Cas system CSM-associated protein Csm3 (group 7 of RAMP superfamily)
LYFEIIGEIEEIETIALGGRIRDIMRLRKQYGLGRWRKLKGVAKVRLESGRVCKAEVHWYEAHGIGRKKMKIKRLLD